MSHKRTVFVTTNRKFARSVYRTGCSQFDTEGTRIDFWNHK